MNCPFCNDRDTRVVDSRLLLDNNSIKRRRKCESCQKRFTTFERPHIDMPPVVKKDGRREHFVRDKIYSGIYKACQKRPVSTDTIEKIVDDVEKTILEMNTMEIGAQNIGNIIIGLLSELDPVAYVRFASVYWDFNDIEQFVKDLKYNRGKDGTKNKF